eukprot:scaffold37919_cov37-Phaeocystis_antarctica.AAC.2
MLVRVRVRVRVSVREAAVVLERGARGEWARRLRDGRSGRREALATLGGAWRRSATLGDAFATLWRR